jgi:cell division protein FtsW
MYGAVGLGVMHLLARHDLGAGAALHAMLLVAAFVMLLLVLVPGSGARQRRAPLAGRRAVAVPAGGGDEARARAAHASACSRRAPRRADPAPRGAADLPARRCAVLLIAAQPDLGTALVICFTLAALLVAAGAAAPARSRRGDGGLFWCSFALFEPYRRARLTPS